jgi:N-carbamoylputrescine amidase
VRGGRALALVALVFAACADPAPAHAPDLRAGGRIHVAAIQYTVTGGDLASNQANLDRLVREAAGRGARYIVLPEYYPGQIRNTAASTVADVRATAQPLDGPIARHMLALCKALGVYVAFPLAERRADGKVYNSTVYAGPDGIEGVYSKRVLVQPQHPAPPGSGPQRDMRGRLYESEIFTPGTTDGVLTWGGVRIGALICADGGMPATYQTRRAKGVQMFTHASGSAGVKRGANNPMPDAAARLYQRPVVFANHWMNRLLLKGNTQICDARGNILARVGPQPNAVVDAEVELPPVEPATPAS